MAGKPGPSPMANASGTVPIIAASGAAAAMTRNTILGVVRVALRGVGSVDISPNSLAKEDLWGAEHQCGVLAAEAERGAQRETSPGWRGFRDDRHLDLRVDRVQVGRRR